MGDIFDVLKAANKLEKRYQSLQLDNALRIAVIGSVSLQHFVKVLRFQLNERGIVSSIYEGEYNGIVMDVFQDNSPLFAFKPEIVIILCHYMDIKTYPHVLAEDYEIERIVNSTVSYYEQIWERISSKSNCMILQSNYAIPYEKLFGNLEREVKYSRSSFFLSVNSRLQEKKPSNVTIIDTDSLSNRVGKINWFDYSAYFLSKLGCKLDFLLDYCRLFSSAILNIKGKVRKCLVLDLDNTLWGGIVGDVGFNGIQIDPNNAVGEAFLYFQGYLKDLKNRGVILAVCSKNDEKTAKEPFEKNEYMILKLDDFGCFVANWEDKASNIKNIAAILNIGVDSLVFFDDNPAERDIVRTFLPEVHVVDVPEDPANYVRVLDYEQPFDWASITKEDLLRSDSYVQNAKRAELMDSFVDYDQYLTALEMEGECKSLNYKDVKRFTQLLNKSNQFNLRTQRYTESQVTDFCSDKSKCCLCVKLKDKYSDYGLISCIVLDVLQGEAFIESWVMSCRVIKRGVERFAFAEVLKQCELRGLSVIKAEYIRSPKNSMVSEFFDSLGFEVVSEKDGTKKYEYNIIKNTFDEKHFIERKDIGYEH